MCRSMRVKRQIWQLVTDFLIKLRMQKDVFLPPIAVKWPCVGQPDNFICLTTLMLMASISTDLQALNFKSYSKMVD